MTTNGTPPGDPFGDTIAALEAVIDHERERQAPLLAEVAQSREREKRAQRALDALTGTPRSTRPRTRPSEDQKWTISETKIAQVWRAAQVASKRSPEDTFTVAQVAAQAGSSSEAVRRSFRILRERELIRVAGTIRGGGAMYALMPDAAGRSSDGA